MKKWSWSHAVPWCVLLVIVVISRTSMAVLLPPEGFELHQIHVQFEWTQVVGASDHQLQVVVDDLGPDPFSTALPVVDVVAAGADPRLVITAGLAFGQSYAWRVRGIDGGPLAWGATHRFSIAAIPPYFPALTIAYGSGTAEPGLTLFTIRDRTSGSGSLSRLYTLAIDQDGEVVWLLERGGDLLHDLRLLDNGRVMVIESDRAWELTLGGNVAWASPDDPDYRVHHEAFPMPNGNVLVAIHEMQEVDRDGDLQNWLGDAFVEFDRWDNSVIWEWSVFDHYSTLDFDETIMEDLNSATKFGVPYYDWTHSNAVIYDPVDASVIISVRHLSRVTRIDYATGQIVYNMGFAMPSGDASFGDDLFSFQHAPLVLPGGNMLIYDNGNRRGHVVASETTGVSKALELSFTGTPPSSASIAWEYTIPVYTPFVGNVELQPGGTTLVTAGSKGKIYEVEGDGTVVWSLAMPDESNYTLYRARRIAELVPDVPGDADADGLADEVDNCPDHANAGQEDVDGDGIGDVCARALGLGLSIEPPTIPLLPGWGRVLLVAGLLGMPLHRLARGRRSA